MLNNGATRKHMRMIHRYKHTVDHAHKARDGGGEREKARRVKQMLRQNLRAENGVVQEFEEPSHEA